MNDAVMAGFLDEMEKLAGLPRAILEGGGGSYGELLRAKKGFGTLAEKQSIWKRAPFQSSGRDVKEQVNQKLNLGPFEGFSRDHWKRTATGEPYPFPGGKMAQPESHSGLAPKLRSRLQEKLRSKS